MTEIYFVVERTQIGEKPAIYEDFLPPKLFAKGATNYMLRLDLLLPGHPWIGKGVGYLYAAYLTARAHNGLGLPPPNVTPPKKEGDGPAKALVGDRLPKRWRRGKQFPPEGS